SLYGIFEILLNTLENVTYLTTIKSINLFASHKQPEPIPPENILSDEKIVNDAVKIRENDKRRD
ncbi:hypothetical protein DRZ77_03230, partial [Candidatus Woesearchaeota archaeon]